MKILQLTKTYLKPKEDKTRAECALSAWPGGGTAAMFLSTSLPKQTCAALGVPLIKLPR